MDPPARLSVLDGSIEPGYGGTSEAGRYFLAFKQSSIGNDPGDGSMYQEITVTFSRPVDGLRFALHVIDALDTHDTWACTDYFECEPTPCPTGPSGRPIASRLS